MQLFLNFINSYDYGQNIIIDLIGYYSPDILKQMFLEKLRNGVMETNLTLNCIAFEIFLRGYLALRRSMKVKINDKYWPRSEIF